MGSREFPGELCPDSLTIQGHMAKLDKILTPIPQREVSPSELHVWQVVVQNEIHLQRLLRCN